MKAPDLVQAVQELTAIMSPQAREVYERHTGHIKKETMKTNKERLEVIHKINYGVLAVNDPTKESADMEPDLFTALGALQKKKEPPQATIKEPEPIEVSQEPPEPVREPPPLPTPQKSAQEWLKDEPEPPQGEDHPFTDPSALQSAPKMLLVDAIATGGESVDLLSELAPWIADIEAKYSRPMCMIAYDEGWKHLGARLSAQKTWLFEKNIVTIDSSHPLYRHCSHVLVSLADITIKATR